MKKDSNMLDIEKETVRDCPLLYGMASRPMTETCMCWGWECDEGWFDIISSASRKLEAVNSLFYPKFRVRIQADQIKEKFGTLRFYYSVVKDPGKARTWAASIFRSVEEYFGDCSRFEYKMKEVVDAEPYDYDDVKEISEEEYERELSRSFKASNVELKTEDGKYFRITHLRDYGKRHYEPTRHKLFYYIGRLSGKMYHKLMDTYGDECTDPEARNCIELMADIAGKTVKEAHDECYSTCEVCGTHIGEDYSPRCRTEGWVKYVCCDCAEKLGRGYVKTEDSSCNRSC